MRTADDVAGSMLGDDPDHDPAANDAAVCRKSCGVIAGNVSSACWHTVTAGANTSAQ